MDRAIGHFRAALVQEDAGISLHALEQLANLEIRHGANLIATPEKKNLPEGKDVMIAGLKRIKLLLNIGRTVERLSLLASYWKRRAQVLRSDGKSKEVKEALLHMEQAYWDATDASLRRNGIRDYYPLINALDGAFLNAVRGEAGSFDERRAQLRAFIDEITADGRRRYAEKSEFFHALAEVEAERIDALWACLDDRPQACITRTEIQKGLAARYSDLIIRLSTVREQDSATNQLRFLIAMLPANDTGKPIKKALQQLIDQIEKRTAEKT